MCLKIHKLCSEMPLFNYEWFENKEKRQKLREQLPHDGLYIFLEAEGTTHPVEFSQASGKKFRIVRVGINDKDSADGKKALFARLNQHYSQSGTSSFRKDIKTAVGEEKVDGYLKKLFFVVFAIKKQERRLQLESKIINTVAFCDNCQASKSWAGNKTKNWKIKETGLWVKESVPVILGKEDLEELKGYAGNAKRGSK
jgi:hypothetical protein